MINIKPIHLLTSNHGDLLTHPRRETSTDSISSSSCPWCKPSQTRSRCSTPRRCPPRATPFFCRPTSPREVCPWVRWTCEFHLLYSASPGLNLLSPGTRFLRCKPNVAFKFPFTFSDGIFDTPGTACTHPQPRWTIFSWSGRILGSLL